MNGIHEVAGSIPASSTISHKGLRADNPFVFFRQIIRPHRLEA